MQSRSILRRGISMNRQMLRLMEIDMAIDHNTPQITDPNKDLYQI